MSGFLSIGSSAKRGRLVGSLANAAAQKKQKQNQSSDLIQNTGVYVSDSDIAAAEGSSAGETSADRIAARNAQLEADGVLIGDTMNDKSYDKVNAEVKRRQWNQFEQDDMPYILQYADDITSGKYSQRAVEQAMTGVNRGYDIAAQNQQMRDTGMGVQLSGQQVADRASDMKRNRTASLIDAANNAKLAAKDRDTALLAGSAIPTTTNSSES